MGVLTKGAVTTAKEILEFLKKNAGDSPELISRKHKLRQKELDIDTDVDYYHGTNADFSGDEFKPYSFVTDKPEYANQFSSKYSDGLVGGNPNVRQVNLKRNLELATLDDIKRMVGPGNVHSGAPYASFDPMYAGDDVVNALKEKGFDGVYLGKDETGSNLAPHLKGAETMLFDPKSMMGKFGAGIGAATLGSIAAMQAPESRADVGSITPEFITDNKEPNKYGVAISDTLRSLDKRLGKMSSVLPLEDIARLVDKHAYGGNRSFMDYFNANSL